MFLKIAKEAKHASNAAPAHFHEFIQGRAKPVVGNSSIEIKSTSAPYFLDMEYLAALRAAGKQFSGNVRGDLPFPGKDGAGPRTRPAAARPGAMPTLSQRPQRMDSAADRAPRFLARRFSGAHV